MTSFINEPKEILEKDDMVYDLVDGEYKTVYKPCVCLFQVI